MIDPISIDCGNHFVEYQLASIVVSVQLVKMALAVDIVKIAFDIVSVTTASLSANIVGTMFEAGLLSRVSGPLLVGVGGALGAACRFLVGRLVVTDGIPWATVIVNVLGSFALGLIVFVGFNDSILLFVGVGFCGAFTTFSTFSIDTIQLFERARPSVAIGYALGTLICAIGAIGGAWLLVDLLG